MKTDPSWQTLTIEEARALPEEGMGLAIYFLWRAEELLYIGASTQVMVCVVGGGNRIKRPASATLDRDIHDLLVFDIPNKKSSCNK